MATEQDEFLFRLESAGAEEFADLLRDPGHDDALRLYFGGELRELRALAEPRRAAKLGNVVVLHGVLGSHLAAGGKTIWLNPWNLLCGEFSRLKLGGSGIEALGLLKRYYGRQILTLGQRWNVRAFAYDWRLTLNEAARELAKSLDAWFVAGEPVHLVAHSMGGLVARAFLALRPEHQGRLVMLGTPNRGSYAITQLLHGRHSLLSPLALVDLKHTRGEVLEIIRSWAGVHEMDPRNEKLAGLPVDAERMVYIAGSGRRTAVGICDGARLGEKAGYTWTQAGDGTVPHCLGLIEGVPTYYADEEHGGLPGNAQVLAAVDDILEKGATAKLARTPVVSRGEGQEASGEMAGFLSSRAPKSNLAKGLAKIAVRCGGLESARDVDAIVVAHYEGVPPHLVDSRPALRAMAERLPSALGEPFYIPAKQDEGPPLLVMGLGAVGRLGEAELAVLVARLVWSAEHMGLTHVATTLIGAGAGNLTVEQAARIWREGLGAALSVTFFEKDERRAAVLAGCFEATIPSQREVKAASRNAPIARLSVERTQGGYRVALLTRDASIPEREIAVDHALVEEVNAKLAEGGMDSAEWAECLRRLLLPVELRNAAARPGPVVVACDRATAQINWEHLHPAVSRQFRSLRAPFRAQQSGVRSLLLVADTCADAPLPGAAEEGRALAELLRDQGLVVKALIGPQEATRAGVLRELMLRRYDAMHYAGHCYYAADDPSASGWMFTGGLALSAREMERLDRVPGFVFSNACESGRVAPRPADVPSFAEVLFGLGVQNLIATARPVGDAAAGAFAQAFYSAASAPFHEAMMAGREAAGWEAATWQHYGNPATVLF